jgi:hypothetical protein
VGGLVAISWHYQVVKTHVGTFERHAVWTGVACELHDSLAQQPCKAIKNS